MKFIITAEMLLILLSNGIRFWAVKRYMDFFVSREKCRWKHIWVIYFFACIETYVVSIVFDSPSWNIISNLLALFLISWPYQIKISKKILMTLIIYSINLFADIIVVQLLSGYVPGQRVGSVYQFITSLVILIPTAFFQNLQREKKMPLSHL